jgi:hypothetical protein
MSIPGFTAEASLNGKVHCYVSLRGMPIMGDGSHVRPASFAALSLRHILFPFPGPIDVCGACVGDCIRRGGNYFSCRNLCSFVCE